MTPHFVIVGNPRGPRVVGFQQALTRLGRPPADVIAWADLLAGRATLGEFARPETVVRIDSPGRDFEVERLLLAEGAGVPEDEDLSPESIDRDAALSLEPELGRVRCPRQWYRGFRAVLNRIDAPGIRWMNHPADVAVMFDKRLCQRDFEAAGIPVPFNLGKVRNFDELRERMRDTGRDRVFVKLAHGSTASGVVALATAAGRLRARTTAELVRANGEWRIYNSRRLRVYDSPGMLAVLIDRLAAEGIQVEEWLPKDRFMGQDYDLRVVVIGGKSCHVVPRLSHGPMTNLHLLNERGDPAALRSHLPSEVWDRAVRTCERAMARYPRSFYAGVDLLVLPCHERVAVMEINAFGDLLNSMTWQGMDTFTAEIVAMNQRVSR